MSSFNDLIGRETDLPQVGRTIRLFAEAFDLPIVGAFHVTCSDETESECADVFERLFAQPLLPSLKTERRAPFRAANLGARYEPGTSPARSTWPKSTSPRPRFNTPPS